MTRHTHRTSGQVLTHSHPGGDREHGYFEHHEDGVHITCDHGTPIEQRQIKLRITGDRAEVTVTGGTLPPGRYLGVVTKLSDSMGEVTS
jgi:hypothetical protein